MKQIISASITPFTSDNKLDLDSAVRLYEYNLTQGIDGFFVPGTMGEWALLTQEEKDALVECVCKVVGSRAKVLLGVSDTGMPGILRNMEKWSHLSHSHWTVILPGSWAGPGGNPAKYMHRIADEADRPVYFYYLPSFNNVLVNPAQFRDMLAHPKIAGLKNSSGDMRLRKELLFLKRSMDFELYEGEEWAADEALLMGCDGVVAGFASTGAKLFKTIARQVDQGDIESAKTTQMQLIDVMHHVYGRWVDWWNVGQKYALKCLGILSSETTRIAAQQDYPDSERASVSAYIEANRDLFV